MSESIKNAILVTLVTLVVWVYAEQENPAEPLTRDVTLKLVADAGSAFIPLLIEPHRSYAIEIQGPTRELRNLEEVLARAGDVIPITVGQGVPATPGQHTVLLDEVLEAHEWFARRGVTVTTPEPQIVEITVDEWQNVQLPVRAEGFDDVELEGPPIVEPSTVPVRVAGMLARRVVADELWLQAIPDAADLARLAEGQSHTIEAAVSPLNFTASDDTFRIDDDTVLLTFRVKSRIAQTTRAAVPIKLVITPLDQDHQVTLTASVIPEVRFSGPRETIERIRNDEIKVFGHLDLTSEDFQKGITEKVVSFDHLPGVEVTNGPHVARFTIEPRHDEAATETEGGADGSDADPDTEDDLDATDALSDA